SWIAYYIRGLRHTFPFPASHCKLRYSPLRGGVSMRVAFIKPPIGGILGLEMLTFVEPLGLICVAGCLEPEGHQCKVIDLRIDGTEEGIASCRAFAPDVVGLQCNFTTERNPTRRLAQRIKREMPGVFVVVGGHDASREPEWFADPAVDA